MRRGNRVAINISPLCGDDSVHILQSTNRRTFEAKPLTPDDVGNAKDASSNFNRRARQNVIMELGYFMGKLGRDRVCALYKGNVELPSDYQGVLYLDMEDSGWKAKVAQELVQSKVPIDVQALLTVLG